MSYFCISPRIKKHIAYTKYETERTILLSYLSPIELNKNYEIEYVKNNSESNYPRNLISIPSCFSIFSLWTIPFLLIAQYSL